MKKISVVVPAINFDQDLELCLQSLLSQINVALEVWVVFNPKRPVGKLSGWPEWIQFLESKKGVNCARNLGMKKSTNDLVFFLDSDCQLMDPHHIEKMAAFMGRFPHAAGFGGCYQLSAQASGAAQAYHFLQMEWLRTQIIGPDFQVRALIGGHMLLRKSLLGGLEFDEKIIFGGSEKELFCRLEKRNLSFFLDLNLNVLHHSDLQRQQLANKARAQGKGEKYIQNIHGKSDVQKWIYLKKLHLNSAWLKDVEFYKRIFSQHAGSKLDRRFSFKRFLYRALDHLNVAQSNIN